MIQDKGTMKKLWKLIKSGKESNIKIYLKTELQCANSVKNTISLSLSTAGA